MNEIIRVITTEQIALTSQLASEIWREHYTDLIGKEQVNYMLDRFQSPAAIKDKISNGELIYFLLYAHHEPAGYFAIQIKGTEIFLSKLYILAAKRKRGLAKAALGFIKNIASENCLERISLTINKNNRTSLASYQKLGFKIAEEVITDIGNGFFMDDFVLECCLPSTG